MHRNTWRLHEEKHLLPFFSFLGCKSLCVLSRFATLIQSFLCNFFRFKQEIWHESVTDVQVQQPWSVVLPKLRTCALPVTTCGIVKVMLQGTFVTKSAMNAWSILLYSSARITWWFFANPAIHMITIASPMAITLKSSIAFLDKTITTRTRTRNTSIITMMIMSSIKWVTTREEKVCLRWAAREITIAREGCLQWTVNHA